MAHSNLSTEDLQSFYANLTRNTFDFNSCLSNTMCLSIQVSNLLRNSFQSLGLDQASLATMDLEKTSQLTSHKRKSPQSSPEQRFLQQSFVPPLHLNQERAAPSRTSQLYRKPVLITLNQNASVNPRKIGGKRSFDEQLEASVKLENKYLTSKKVKLQTGYEAVSDTTSEGSQDHTEVKVKVEEESKEKTVKVKDEIVRIISLKMDKKTGMTSYLVEWKERADGTKLKDSYVKSDDILKDYGQLVAKFYENQIKQKMHV